MDSIIAVTAMIILLYHILDNKSLIKKLSILQIIGVVLTYILYIGIALVVIYYGGNWLVSFIPVNILKYLVFFIIVAVSMYIIMLLLRKTLSKITNGIIKEQPYEDT
ncbi:hypothetical protein ACTNEO_13285 [Gracilibacillus sp. HCP3S3_G5_1]|uniref:hypothetical protein n=1 Tax=unclassified Gracilibacillus TaxID=2625209 RepID=UPI003F89C563